MNGKSNCDSRAPGLPRHRRATQADSDTSAISVEPVEPEVPKVDRGGRKKMGRSKRKNNSPLQRDESKSRRTLEDGDDMENAGGGSQAGQDDVISDLKEFIRIENAISSKNLAQEIRRCNEERMTAIETSLSFALAANETLSKRLVEMEQRAQRTEAELVHSARRLCLVEEQLEQYQQKELRDWLVFSGPAIPRRSQSSRDEDVSRLLCSMIQRAHEL